MDEVTGGEPVLAVARAIRKPHRTLDGQLKSSAGLKWDTIVDIARAYGRDPVLALVEHGLIDAAEAGAVRDLTGAEHMSWLQDVAHGATDEILLAEIGRRLTARSELDSPEGT